VFSSLDQRLVGASFGLVDPGGLGQFQGLGLRASTEPLGVSDPGGVQGRLAGLGGGHRVAVVHVSGGVQADPAVVMFVVVPGEEHHHVGVEVLPPPGAGQLGDVPAEDLPWPGRGQLRAIAGGVAGLPAAVCDLPVFTQDPVEGGHRGPGTPPR
jgi:hypothetical protein